jgi:hypothetical protein
MTSEKFTRTARNLLSIAGFDGTIDFKSLDGGGNNRVFLAIQDQHIVGVIKEYYHARQNHRDRLSSEYRFSQYLWDHQIHQIPMPMACDPTNHLALYSNIPGRKVSAGEITKNLIDQALIFFLTLNRFRHSVKARELPDAQEACFSLSGHIELTEKRVRNLGRIDGTSPVDAKAREFIADELVPVWSVIKEKTLASAVEHNIVPDESISGKEKRLSPSDFGFHNALMTADGTLYFLDFEYAGWDDPAKMVCDFFCQLAIPVPDHFFPYVTEHIVRGLENPEQQRHKIEMLLPVYQVKWCCIVMNEFLPRGLSRRIFMEKNIDSEARKDEQLRKARKIIHTISRNL